MGLQNIKADAKGEYAKHNHTRGLHRWLKKWKARLERRKAKKNPECKDGYGKYKGYEL
ncbi:MAG: hypothetical protein WC942_04225 [Clostridia bacterium]|jgi:hypothetical protein